MFLGSVQALLTQAYLHLWVIAAAFAPPPTDTTGISAAFTRLATLGAGIIGGVVAFFVVVNGYLYLTTSDDLQRGAHAKRAMGGLLFGALIVILGANIAPAIVNAIAGK
jgi:uncharacterized membrane protein YjgN (DUF898 family)